MRESRSVTGVAAEGYITKGPAGHDKDFEFFSE